MDYETKKMSPVLRPTPPLCRIQYYYTGYRIITCPPPPLRPLCPSWPCTDGPTLLTTLFLLSFLFT